MAIGSLHWHVFWYGHIWIIFLPIIGSALICYYSYIKYSKTVKPFFLRLGFILVLISLLMLFTGFGIYVIGTFIIFLYHLGISLTLLGYNINAIKSKSFLNYIIYALTLLPAFYYILLKALNPYISGYQGIWQTYEDFLILVPMLLVLLSVIVTTLTIVFFNPVENIDEMDG